MDFVPGSSSSDPLVREVDQMLYNNGEPLKAGSLPLYGDGTMRASDIIPPWLGEIADATADAMMHFYIELPFALLTAFIPGGSSLVGVIGWGVVSGGVQVAGAYTQASVFGNEFTA